MVQLCVGYKISMQSAAAFIARHKILPEEDYDKEDSFHQFTINDWLDELKELKGIPTRLVQYYWRDEDDEVHCDFILCTSTRRFENTKETRKNCKQEPEKSKDAERRNSALAIINDKGFEREVGEFITVPYFMESSASRAAELLKPLSWSLESLELHVFRVKLATCATLNIWISI